MRNGNGQSSRVDNYYYLPQDSEDGDPKQAKYFYSTRTSLRIHVVFNW